MPKAKKPATKKTRAEREARASARRVASKAAKLMYDCVYARHFERVLAILMSE